MDPSSSTPPSSPGAPESPSDSKHKLKPKKKSLSQKLKKFTSREHMKDDVDKEGDAGQSDDDEEDKDKNKDPEKSPSGKSHKKRTSPVPESPKEAEGEHPEEGDESRPRTRSLGLSRKGTLRAVQRIFKENPFSSGKKEDHHHHSQSPSPVTPLSPSPVSAAEKETSATSSPVPEKGPDGLTPPPSVNETKEQPDSQNATPNGSENPSPRPDSTENGAPTLRAAKVSAESLDNTSNPIADKISKDPRRAPLQRGNSLRVLRDRAFGNRKSVLIDESVSASAEELSISHSTSDKDKDPSPTPVVQFAEPAPTEEKSNLKRGFSISKAFSRGKIVRPGEELKIKADGHAPSFGGLTKTPIRANFEGADGEVDDKRSYTDRSGESPMLLNFPPELNPHEEGITKEESKRRKRIQAKAYIVEELYHTERNYVETLNTVVELFIKPIRAALGTATPILSASDLKTIFSPIEEIATVNSNFLEDLAEIAKTWNIDTKVGGLFQKHFTNCEAYSKFVDNYSLAKAALRRNEERSAAYRGFIQERMSHPDNRRQNLSDHFILPIQRVTRYTLLLNDLLKHTDSDHTDYPNLEQSCQLMKDLASKINEVKRKEETFTKLFEIQKEVENCPPTLVSATRKYITDLSFLEFDATSYAPLPAARLCLFSDVMLISKYPTTNWVSKLGSKNNSKFFKLLELKNVTVAACEDVEEKNLKYLFKITTTDKTPLQFCFQAAYSGQRQEFLDAIHQCVEKKKEVVESPTIKKEASPAVESEDKEEAIALSV